MKSKNMVLLALAVGCGLVAAFLTAKLGAGNKTEMIPVLVAAKNLDQGAKLDKIEELFVRKPFPKESVPPEFIDDPGQLKGKTLQKSIRAGTHVTMADITPKGGIELPVDQKTGIPYKAMAIRVDPSTVVGGLVVPGTRVDVLSVERLTNGKTQAVMVLQNVLVVGVDLNTIRPEDSPGIKNAQTVTLAVKQSEGLILARAEKLGEVKLLLRSPDDDKINKNLRPQTENGPSDRADDDSGSGGTVVDKRRILVAKDTIPPGTKITNPEQYFVEKDYLADSVAPNVIDKWDDLRNKVVMTLIPAQQPPTRDAFVDSGVSPVVPKTPAVATTQDQPKDNTKRTETRFQVGSAAPYTAHYVDGKLVDTNNPAPSGSPGSQEIKPEKKGEEKSD